MDGSAMYVSNIPDCDIEVKNALIGKYGGAEWVAIQRTLPSNPSWQSVTYGNGKFVAVANNGVAASIDINNVLIVLPSISNTYVKLKD